MTRADVIVVGGGVNGASTAFHLASRGVKNVLLLERHHLGAGATGKSGSLVRMQSGHLAVVISQGETSLLLPKVKVFYDTARRQRIPPFEIDLASADGNPKITNVESPGAWNLSKLKQLWMPAR